MLKICERDQTDLLLIAGDLFHRQPLLRELKEVDYLFSELTHTQVVLIAGNHDYIKKDSYYRSFTWSDNVHPLFGNRLGHVEFPEFETAVYGLSYHSREIGKALYDNCTAEGLQRYEILLAHGGDGKHIPFDRKALSESGFDYIALGHIINPRFWKRTGSFIRERWSPLTGMIPGPTDLSKGRSGRAGCGQSGFRAQTENMSIFGSRWMRKIPPGVFEGKSVN